MNPDVLWDTQHTTHKHYVKHIRYNKQNTTPHYKVYNNIAKKPRINTNTNTRIIGLIHTYLQFTKIPFHTKTTNPNK